MERPWACHDDISEGIYLDEFSNLRRIVLDSLCHFGVVMGDGSGSLGYAFLVSRRNC